MTLQSACPGGIPSTITAVVASVGREKTADRTLILDPGLKIQVSGFQFSESMNYGSMLAHLKSEGRDDHNSLVFIR